MTPFYQRPCFLTWIRDQAALIGSDGCSVVLNVHVDCCFEHDLGYAFAKDPRHAYLLFKTGSVNPWGEARGITREAVDGRFRKCLQRHSLLGLWSPMAWWRWAGVRWRGGSRWDAHRQREAQDAQVAQTGD